MSIRAKIKLLFETPGMFPAWVRWMLRYIGIKPVLVQPFGNKVAGFQNFSEFWGARNLIPSKAEIHLIDCFSDREGVMIDVGANLGYFSLLMAAIRPECEVYAFEPSPSTYDRLRENLDMNRKKSVEAFCLALGNSDGKLSFVNDVTSPTTNRLVNAGDSSGLPVIEVDVRTLDQFLEERSVQNVSFLKIDVEGFEGGVLNGAGNALREKRVRAGLIELCPENLKQAGSTISEFLAVVSGFGYRLFYISEDGSLAGDVTEENAERVDVVNVFLSQ